MPRTQSIRPRVPELQVLLTGLAFGESPRWRDDRLWFCNWGRQEIVAVGLDGASEVIARVPTTIPFSIDWLQDGHLVVVSGREARLLRRGSDGSWATHADLSDLSPYPWNEIVVVGTGNIYVNGGADLAGGKSGEGMIALIGSDGSIRQVASGIAFANGMVATPDNARLIVAESHGKKLTAFDIAADGSLSNRSVWADLGDGVPDGITMDAENAIWYADVPNKRCVRVREGGDVLQMLNLDRGCFACMLGGSEGRTLFMMTAEWQGFANMSGKARSGQVVITAAPAPKAGWP